MEFVFHCFIAIWYCIRFFAIKRIQFYVSDIWFEFDFKGLLNPSLGPFTFVSKKFNYLKKILI